MSQPFPCNCGSKACLGRISGAKDVPAEVLKGYFVNKHIQQLKEEQQK